MSTPTQSWSCPAKNHNFFSPRLQGSHLGNTVTFRVSSSTWGFQPLGTHWLSKRKCDPWKGCHAPAIYTVEWGGVESSVVFFSALKNQASRGVAKIFSLQHLWEIVGRNGWIYTPENERMSYIQRGNSSSNFQPLIFRGHVSFPGSIGFLESHIIIHDISLSVSLDMIWSGKRFDIGQNNLTPTYTNPWFAPIRLQYFSRKRFINHFFYSSNQSSVDGFNVSATWHLSPSIFEDQNTNKNPVRCEEVAGIDPFVQQVAKISVVGTNKPARASLQFICCRDFEP